MDQNIRNAGSTLVTALLIFCSFPIFFLGVGMLISFPHPIWWAGLLLVGCSLMIGYGAYTNYRSGKREKIVSERQIGLVQQVKKGIATPGVEAQVLANWSYSVSEWNEFQKWEKRKRKSGILVEAICLFVLGTLILRYFKGADWITALLICSLFGIFYSLLKYKLLTRSIAWKENKLPEVIITTEFAMVNGHMNRFYGENLWLGTVRIKEMDSFNIMEITYRWNTRKGGSFEELRVPIPKGCLKEAVHVQDRLMSARDK